MKDTQNAELNQDEHGVSIIDVPEAVAECE